MSQPERGYNSQKPPGFLNKTREFQPIVRILLQACLNPLTKPQNRLTPDRLLSNLNHRDTQGDTRTRNSLFTLFQNANVRKPAHHGSLSPCDYTISLGVLPCTPTRPGSPPGRIFLPPLSPPENPQLQTVKPSSVIFSGPYRTAPENGGNSVTKSINPRYFL